MDYVKQLALAVRDACVDQFISEKDLEEIIASVPRPESVYARLVALLAGLEVGPLFAEAEPHKLLELGKAIAAQAKESSNQAASVPLPEPIKLSDARLLDALRYYAEAEPVELYTKAEIVEFQRTAKEAIAAAEQAKGAK